MAKRLSDKELENIAAQKRATARLPAWLWVLLAIAASSLFIVGAFL